MTETDPDVTEKVERGPGRKWPDESRERHVPEGCKVCAKLKRGTGTRDQDVINLKARGETAADAVREFSDLLVALENKGWDARLRAVQPDEEDGGEDA